LFVGYQLAKRAANVAVLCEKSKSQQDFYAKKRGETPLLRLNL
jgi:hypothetical protein